MFAVKSTHKRKRSAARRDAAHAQDTLSTGRTVVSVLGGGAERGGGVARKEGDGGRLEILIGSHTFNHNVCALVPISSKSALSELTAELPNADDCVAYHARISPCLLLDPLFSTSYIKRGALLMTSVGRLDQDDVMCVDGTGKLTLSLTKDTYQTLGLQGQPYKQSQKASGWAADRRSGTAERFVVSIDLRASYFTAGRPAYDRVLARFKAWDVARGDVHSQGSWRVIMSWTSNEAPMGAAMQLPAKFVDTAQQKRLSATRTVDVLGDVWLPTQAAFARLRAGWAEEEETIDRPTWPAWREDADIWSEWAALVLAQEECVRTYARPEHMHPYEVIDPREAGTVAIVRYTGFLPAGLGRQITKGVESFMSKARSTSFVHLHATGFADTPICWTRQRRTSSESVVVREANEALDMLFESESEASEVETGVKARRKRNEKRQKRSFNNPFHEGHQVRNPHSQCSASGWQAFLFAEHDDGLAHSVVFEILGDSIRS